MIVEACARTYNRRMDEKPGDTTHFGYRDVPVGEKQKLVGEVFSSVAGKYDLMNDLMSLGVHRVWKRYFVGTSGVARGDRVLDLAGGTGDIAALLQPRVGDEGEVVLGDINAAMLGVGRDRLTDRGLVRSLQYVQLNAEALPFPERSFDLVTIAFGLRNVTDKLRYQTMTRVLNSEAMSGHARAARRQVGNGACVDVGEKAKWAGLRKHTLTLLATPPPKPTPAPAPPSPTPAAPSPPRL